MAQRKFIPTTKHGMLTHLIEEASEVIKIATKIKRFGFDSREQLPCPIAPGNPDGYMLGRTNRDLLQDEYNDFSDAYKRLYAGGVNDEGFVPEQRAVWNSKPQPEPTTAGGYQHELSGMTAPLGTRPENATKDFKAEPEGLNPDYCEPVAERGRLVPDGYNVEADGRFTLNRPAGTLSLLETCREAVAAITGAKAVLGDVANLTYAQRALEHHAWLWEKAERESDAETRMEKLEASELQAYRDAAPSPKHVSMMNEQLNILSEKYDELSEKYLAGDHAPTRKVVLDMHAALGVEWGTDVYAAIDKLKRNARMPNLGLATTGMLIQELASRCATGNIDPSYRTIDGNEADRLRSKQAGAKLWPIEGEGASSPFPAVTGRSPPIGAAPATGGPGTAPGPISSSELLRRTGGADDAISERGSGRHA